MGAYNLDTQTLSYDVMSRIKRRNTSHRNRPKKTGADIAFESKVERFKEWVKPLYMINIGPGKYDVNGDFDEKVSDKKHNVIYSKTSRFVPNKQILKLPGTGAYKPKDEYNKKSFNLLFQGY